MTDTAPIDLTKDVNASSLAGKRILITGGASGLGAAFVNTFAAHGAHVISTDINTTAGQDQEAALTAAGHKVKFITVDVTSWDSQVSMFKDALTWTDKQPLDTIITCAGIANGVPLKPESPDALWNIESNEHAIAQRNYGDAVIKTNLLGTMYTLKLGVQYAMGVHESDKALGFKSVVLLSSLAGYGGIPMNSDYGAAKFGVRGAFQSIKGTLREQGVRLNLVAPFFIKTAMTAPLIAALEAGGARLAAIEDATTAVVRLTTDESAHARCLAITAEGIEDLLDDVPSGSAGTALKGFADRSTFRKAPAA